MIMCRTVLYQYSVELPDGTGWLQVRDNNNGPLSVNLWFFSASVKAWVKLTLADLGSEKLGRRCEGRGFQCQQHVLRTFSNAGRSTARRAPLLHLLGSRFLDHRSISDLLPVMPALRARTRNPHGHDRRRHHLPRPSAQSSQSSRKLSRFETKSIDAQCLTRVRSPSNRSNCRGVDT